MCNKLLRYYQRCIRLISRVIWYSFIEYTICINIIPIIYNIYIL